MNWTVLGNHIISGKKSLNTGSVLSYTECYKSIPGVVSRPVQGNIAGSIYPSLMEEIIQPLIALRTRAKQRGTDTWHNQNTWLHHVVLLALVQTEWATIVALLINLWSKVHELNSLFERLWLLFGRHLTFIWATIVASCYLDYYPILILGLGL